MIYEGEAGYNKNFLFVIATFFLCLYFFISPLDMMLNITGSGTITKYVGVILIGVCLILMINRRLVIHWDLTIIGIVILMYTSITFYFSNWPDISLSRMITFYNLMALFLVIINVGFQAKYKKWAINSVIASGVIISLYLIINYEELILNRTGRVTITTENGGFVDPNSLAVYLCISFIFCVDRLLNELGKLRRILILISTTLIILAILFTGSRGGMLSLLVAISCFVLTYIFQWEIRRKNIVNLFYILLTIVIFLIVSNTLLPKELIERFSFSNWTSDGGSDRTLIWKLTIENLLERYSIFGSGVGTFPYVFEYHVGWFKVAHNTWLELLIEKGIIGLSLWITLIILLFKKAIKNKESTIIVLLISIIVAETFLSAEVSKHWWNTLMLSMLYTKEIYHKKIS